MKETAIQDSWLRCYGEGWVGTIVPEAMAHPAKFSRGLIRRIYEHAAEEGWLVPGTRVRRISFFRRLHEKKNPETKIEWEDVICMVKE